MPTSFSSSPRAPSGARSRLPFVAIVALSMALAGCLGAQNQIESKSFNLAYDGAQSGNHEATGACDSEGTLAGRGTIHDGRVRIRMSDGSGNTRFDKTYSGDFTIETQDLAGASGTWKMSGERDGNDALLGDQFKGSYSITVRC
ncbi:MAG TPA: hypothetical protein VFH78_12795 [Candidatus Thermoplasmatota archaeon]|nr:hypothetical protein [Candidatus Thermoplasmatota archaeon]